VGPHGSPQGSRQLQPVVMRQNTGLITFLINWPCLAATPTFCELAFVLVSATATPGFTFTRVWEFSFTKCRNQFQSSIIIRIVHYPHRWTSIRGNWNFPPDSIKMSYGPKFVVLFIARIETIVTPIQNNDRIVNAPMVRLSNAPPPIT